MNKQGPIIVIEDDLDDQELIAEAYNELGHKNELVFFSDGHKALDFLKLEQVVPFLIISDINMPRINGYELKSMIHANAELSAKCIPFLFFTTVADSKAVTNAYAHTAQGLFAKPNSMKDLKDILSLMISYWQKCNSPNNFKKENKKGLAQQNGKLK